MNPNYTFKVFDEFNLEGGGDVPLHGFRGNTSLERQTSLVPAALSIAVSRQAGARGGTLGKRVARELGWEVYTQEVLEYILREEDVRREILERLSPAASCWAQERMDQLVGGAHVSRDPAIVDLARLVLAIGAQGKAVFIGRGAGHFLPAASTLHVRIAAPLADRVAYMAQWLRLTQEEAFDQVRSRDQHRSEFLAQHIHHDEADVAQYDMVLNSCLLGEGLCVDLILRAAQTKALHMKGTADSSEEAR